MRRAEIVLWTALFVLCTLLINAPLLPMVLRLTKLDVVPDARLALRRLERWRLARALVDFHAMERALDGIIGRFHNRNLNDTPPFDHINPSAELVAQFIAVELSGHLPRGVFVQSVSVGEAPGCTATYLSPFQGTGR